MTAQPVEVEARGSYRIRLRYSDGASGEGDLSHLAGRGVFEAWTDRSRFEAVHLAPHGAISWDEDIELCADDLYLRLTGKSVEDVAPDRRRSATPAVAREAIRLGGD